MSLDRCKNEKLLGTVISGVPQTLMGLTPGTLPGCHSEKLEKSLHFSGWERRLIIMGKYN